MNPSLSIVLPVFDAEDRLAEQVHDLLDVLPELTHRFEILIVDDGSDDDTPHVADELATCYPQVRLVRHPFRLGLAEAIQTGLDNTQGELVLVGDERFGLNLDDLRKLWALREDEELIVARQPTRHKRAQSQDRKLIERLLNWTPPGQASSRKTGTLHAIRRQAFEELREFERARLDSIAHRVDSVTAKQRPNMLSKLKQFALGE